MLPRGITTLHLTSAGRLGTLRKYNKTSLNSGHVNLATKEPAVRAGGGDERTQTDTARKPNLTLYIVLYYTHINNIPVYYIRNRLGEIAEERNLF